MKTLKLAHEAVISMTGGMVSAQTATRTIKTLLFVALSLFSLTVFGQKKIALLEPRVGEGSSGVSGMEKAMLRGELRKSIVNHTGYEAFTRADIDKLMSEQNFQRTGLVSEAQIKKIGMMSGADYICVSTLNKTNSEFYLEAYLVNVESAQISNPASQYGELKDGKLANMLPVCQALAQELLGTISPVVSKFDNNQSSKPQSSEPKGIRKIVQNVKDSKSKREAEKEKQKAEKEAEEARLEAEEARLLLNDKVGNVMPFPDGTKGVVFYAENGVGLAVSVDNAEMKWQEADKKKKDFVDVKQIVNRCDDDKVFSAGMGINYTRAIIAALESPAAEWCVKHGDGWYLPSAGELVRLFKVHSLKQGAKLIDDALIKAGGTAMDNGWYWSSSECDGKEAINVSYDSRSSCEEKISFQKVRAVRSFSY